MYDRQTESFVSRSTTNNYVMNENKISWSHSERIYFVAKFKQNTHSLLYKRVGGKNHCRGFFSFLHRFFMQKRRGPKSHGGTGFLSFYDKK